MIRELDMDVFIRTLSLYWGAPVAAFIGILLTQLVVTPETASIYPAIVVGALTPWLIYWQRSEMRTRFARVMIGALYLIAGAVLYAWL